MKKMASIFIILSLLFISCEKKVQLEVNLPKKPQQNQPIEVNVNNINQSEIDKITIDVNKRKFTELTYQNNFTITLNDSFKLGTHHLEFHFFSNNKKIKSISKKISLYSGIVPKVLSYKLINTYPHDIEAFTQGLEFYKDTLYESTGLNGFSSLRKTDYKSGKILKKVDLDKKFFAEGITLLNHKVYQLTWLNKIGFIYDTQLNKIGEFAYNKSQEGWGLCNDGKVIYKSDGTEKIWILDPETLKEKDYINVYTNNNKITKINEMEWVNGKIYTNVWQKNALAIINPKTGAVEAIVNLSDLHKKVQQHPKLDVLNGIAYHKKTGHLFVTGKKWNQLFEIVIE